MDNPLTRYEHEEFRKTVEAKFSVIEAENKRQNERLRAIEKTTEQISAMNVTLQKQSDNISELSGNIARLATSQEAESKRLQDLESQDGKKWRSVINAILVAVAGAVVGALFTWAGLA